jgi:hypothetical protein
MNKTTIVMLVAVLGFIATVGWAEGQHRPPATAAVSDLRSGHTHSTLCACVLLGDWA